MLLAVAVVSAAILAYQVLLMRLFSIMGWHHFAYMIISVALLGFGASGTALALVRDRLLPRFQFAFVACCGLFALVAVGSFAAAVRLPFNPLAIVWDSSQLVWLAASYALLVLPFFFGGSAIGLAFARAPDRIGQTYAFDLATLKPRSDGDWIRTSERSTSELFDPDPNDESYQAKPQSFVRELAQRFTDWLYPIAFALWAVVVASHPRTNRQGPSPAMMLGLVGALSLKALGFVTLSLVERDTRMQALVYALPLLSILASLILIRADIAVSQLPVIDRISEAFRAIPRAFRRLLPSAAPAEGARRP